MPRGKFLTGQNSRLQTFAGPCFSKSPKPSRPQTQRKPQTTKSGNTTPEPAARDTTSRPSKTRTEIDEPHTSPTAPIKQKLQVNFAPSPKAAPTKTRRTLAQKAIRKATEFTGKFLFELSKEIASILPPTEVPDPTHRDLNYTQGEQSKVPPAGHQQVLLARHLQVPLAGRLYNTI